MKPTGGGPAIAPTLENLDRIRNSQILQTGAAVHKGDRVLEIKVVRVEQIDEHWGILRGILQRQGIEVMQSLPQKNVRRIEKNSLQKYFYNDALIDKALRIYGDDVSLFYNDTSIDSLIANAPLPQTIPLQSRSLKLSSWLRDHVFMR